MPPSELAQGVLVGLPAGMLAQWLLFRFRMSSWPATERLARGAIVNGLAFRTAVKHCDDVDRLEELVNERIDEEELPGDPYVEIPEELRRGSS